MMVLHVVKKLLSAVLIPVDNNSFADVSLLKQQHDNVIQPLRLYGCEFLHSYNEKTKSFILK